MIRKSFHIDSGTFETIVIRVNENGDVEIEQEKDFIAVEEGVLFELTQCLQEIKKEL